MGLFSKYSYCEETAKRKVASRIDSLRSDPSSKNRHIANLAHGIGIEKVLHAMCKHGGPMFKHFSKTEGSYQVPVDALRRCVGDLAGSIKAKKRAENYIKF